MKRFLFILITLLSFTPYLKAQNYNLLLIRDFTRYNTLLIEKRFEEAVQYANPKLFEYMPKEDLIKVLQSTYQLKDMDYRPYMPTIISMSDPISQNDGDHIKITFNSTFDIKFNNKDFKSESHTSTLLDLERKFGIGKVKFDPETQFFNIQTVKNVIASSYDQQNSWTFITIDNPRAFYVLETIVPKELLY